LWQKDKAQYRARYYENGPAFENAETIFGKKIAKMLEDGIDDKILNRVPRYQYKEYRIELKVGGVKFLGVLDSFSKRMKRVLEFKTGKIPWDAVRTAKHDQLVVYSLLVKKKFGKVDPWCRLVWIPTRYKMTSEMVGSRMMEGESREIELIDTKPLVFRRRIAEWERKRMREKIVECAKEISEDYSNYLKNHHEPSK
jgi:hypothetical protein